MGEPVGYSGKGEDNLRSDLEYEPGTEVTITALDQDGNTLSNAYARLEINYSAPYTHLSRVHMIPITEGKVAIPMPPKEYNATFSVRVVQGGTNNTSPEEFTITTEEVYSKIDPAYALGELTANVETTPVPCVNDNTCVHWAAGTVCSNETKTCEGKAGFEEPTLPTCMVGEDCGEEGGILQSIPCCSTCCSFLGLLIPMTIALGSALVKNII
jgi:hypothetical protein